MRIISIVFLLAAFGTVAAEETIQNEDSEQPLYLGLPFDVLPIEFDGGHRPAPFPENGVLTVTFLSNPLKQYTVKWLYVESIELFCELVLREFRQRLDGFADEARSLNPKDDDWKALAGKLEGLYDYLLFLEDYKGELPDLQKAYCKFLFEEAVYRIKSGDHATGLIRFETIYRENKDYPGLSKAWGSALDIVLGEKIKTSEYIETRQLLAHFAKFYPDHPVVRQWEERIQQGAKDYWERSKKSFEDKNFLNAHLYCEESVRIAINPDEFEAWRRELQKNAPRLNVAVQSPSDSARLADWGTIRQTRLTQRLLAEYIQPSPEGGVYKLPLGTLEKSDRNRLLRWKINPNQRWAEYPGTLDSFAVADALLAPTQFPEPGASAPGDFASSVPSPELRGQTPPARLDTIWSGLLGSLDIVSPTELAIRLNRPYLLPEALFDLPVAPSQRFAVPFQSAPIESASTSSSALSGPFVPRPLPFDKIESFPRKGFEISPVFTPKNPLMPKVIVEYIVNRSEEAAELFNSGKVDMIDRIAPWDVEKYQSNTKWTTGRYAIPTTCFIVPNFRKQLPASRTFRRALLYGLNREKMLEKISSRGMEATILSGPFIKGASLGDPLGYAYDSSIAPRPYEPKLAIALALLAFGQIRDKALDGEERSETIPEMVLARPTGETANFVSLMIRRQWEAIGVPVREVEYGPNEQIGQGTDVDFWYVERTIKEPLVDAERLFGRFGLLGGGSSYLELGLERVRRAEDWPTASKRLMELHRLCFEETTVLPLWQISEHFVHRAGIEGVRSEPPILNLYQNIENWSVSK